MNMEHGTCEEIFTKTLTNEDEDRRRQTTTDDENNDDVTNADRRASTVI